MTEKLFDLDSYCTQFCASVLSCEPASKNGMQGFAVELDRTCFFPEGGGQPADTGCLQAGDQSAQVLYTYEQGEAILHLCDQPLPVGSTVEGVLNFERRFANMQIHSGEHILSGLILKELGLHNVGFHMGHESNTIDLDGEISAEQVRMLEEKVNALVCQNHPVFVSYPSAEALAALPLRKKPEVDHLRLVEIQDCDLCGCCGTHVAHTGEIGLLKIIDSQRYKGGTRLTFLCGAAALKDCADRCQSLKQICVGLSCKPQEAFSNVEKLKAELAAKKQELEGIDQETAKEMESLTEQSNAAEAKIDARLLAAYKRIRGNVRNGLAVVTVKRDACGGCYNRIPPQRQLDIRMSKKIIVCEYCGRILVSDQLDEEAAEQ